MATLFARTFILLSTLRTLAPFPRAGISWPHILATFLVASVLCWSSYAIAAEKPAWFNALTTSDQLYNQGRGKSALLATAEPLRLAHDSGPFDELFVLRFIQDICFRIVDFDCAVKYGTQIVVLINQIIQMPNLAPTDHRRLMVESLERDTRLSLMFRKFDRAQTAAHQLEQTLGDPETSYDFVRANLTLTEAALQRNDLESARRFLRAGWVYFLINPNIPHRQFMRFAAEFIDLFRATGQSERAFALVAIATPTLATMGRYFVYEAFALLFAGQQVALDRNQAAGVITAMRSMLEMLDFPELELDDPLRAYYRTSALLILVVNCALGSYPNCPDDDAAKELERYLEKKPDTAHVDLLMRQVAVALAMSAALHGHHLSHAAEAVLQASPPDQSNGDDSEERTVYYSGRYFLAVARRESDRLAFAQEATRSELLRLRRLQRVEPFNVAPLGLYTRALFFITAAELARKPARSVEEDDELLELASYLNRSKRSIESDYLYLLSRIPTQLDRVSLKALHSAEQSLVTLERQTLKNLVNGLLQRQPGEQRAPLPTETWREFGELNSLIETHKDVRRRVGELIAAPSQLFSELRASLKENERFVTQFGAGNFFARVCVGRTGMVVGTAALNGQDDVVQVKLLQAALTNPSPPSPAIDAQFPLAASQRLSDIFLGEDERCLGNADYVVFAPPWDLLSVPFHILIDPGKPRQKPANDTWFDGIQWLGTTRAISTVMDAKQFLASRALHVARVYPHAFLGVGDPRLSGKTDDGADRTQFALRGVKRGGNTQLANLEELPDTANELKGLSQIFGASSEVLLGEAASELAVRRRFLQDYRVVSFATHGLIREEIAGLNEAALLLTPKDSGVEVDDGLLTATEIAQLDVPADLVILSACNSARFDLDLFGPEAASLSSAFFLAGTHSTLASLWSVDSEATAQLMNLFAKEYTKVPAPGPSIALRNAIRAFIASARINEYRNPRFWAAFTLYGDGAAQIQQAATITDFNLDPISWGGQESLGEIQSVTRFAGGLILTGYLDDGKRHRAGQLQFVDSGGKLLWQIRNGDRLFVAPGTALLVPNLPSVPAITSSATSDRIIAISVLAWAPSVGKDTVLELLTYSADGHLLASAAVSGVAVELVDGFLRIGEDRFLIATHGDHSETSPGITLRVVNRAGQVLATKVVSGQGSVKVIAAARGFWLAVTGDDSSLPRLQRLNPIGMPEYCPSRNSTWIYGFTPQLEQVANFKLEDMELADLMELRLDTMLVAGSTIECAGGIRRSFISEVDAQGVHQHDIPITDFSNAATKLIRNADGTVLLIGSMEFLAGKFVESPAFDKAAFNRQISPYRQAGSYVARFDPATHEIRVTPYFNGTDLSFTGLAPFGSGWMLVGSNGYSPFAAFLTPGNRPH